MDERRQERKVVTVLFCDLVGFTQRAEDMDPEDVASLLEPYHARLKEELERYGGTVEKFIGDAVMALFGAPVAHEDDAERAVRAALAIREFAEEEAIELRIGITTGEALVTLGARPEQGETMATGDVVNTAARLQSAAPVNGILVSEKTHEATKQAIEYDRDQEVDVKGKARPVLAWEAIRPRSRVTLDRLHGTPLVGRERELGLLVGALERARAERQPQLVTLIGVPGIGKSRLVFELSQAVDLEPELISWRQGRCLPYGDGVTFWALGEIVKAQAGVLETDPPEVAEEKLRAATSDEWIQSQLRPLVGLGVEGVAGGNGREEAFTAWRRYLEDIAAERPLVLVFEDLHWADENMLDFVDHLVDWGSGVALLVLCIARPELLERRTGWGGGKTNALTVSLSSLSNEETARLVGGLVQQAVLPAKVQETLLARAGGNPLYAEQYARLLEERLADDVAMPETVHGIIAARLDMLDAVQKGLLQDAAVVGKLFWLGALTSISGVESRAAEASLHALERKGFVRRERETSIEGDSEYAFLHVLVREVAYGQIPRAARAEKHRLAASWIEDLARSDDYAEMLAHHYGEALALSQVAGVETTELEAAARLAFRDAGDRALALNAYPAALRFYEQALELWAEGGVDRSRLLFRRAKAHFLAVDSASPQLFAEATSALLADGDRETAAEAGIWEAIAMVAFATRDEALERATSAAALLEDAPAGPTKAYVVANWARNLFLAGRHQTALEVGTEALGMADELGLHEVRANALNTIGMARMGEGDLGGIDDLEESLRLARAHSSPFEISRIHNNLGIYSWIAGRTERASELFAARLELDERFGIPPWFGEAVMAVHEYWTGRWSDAAQRIESIIGAESAPASWELLRSVRAALRLAQEDVTGAVEDYSRARELLGDDWGGAEIEPPALCMQVALATDRHADADDLATSVLAFIWKPAYGGAGVVLFALLLEELGRPVERVLEAARAHPGLPWLQAAAAVASGELDAAADQLSALRCPTLESFVRLRLAERLVAEGRRVQADVHLEKALAFWRSVGATRYVREAEALLTATA